MNSDRFTKALDIEAVAQVTARNYAVTNVVLHG